MKKIIYLVFVGIKIFLLSSCVMGPINTFETGRTSGEGRGELFGGLGSTGFVGKLNYGLSENFDIGVQLETFSLGGRLKYALMNNQEKGFSFSIASGAGVGGGGSSHYYGDILMSYLSGDFEPYGSARFVHAINKSYKDKNDMNNDWLFSIQKPEFDYQQYNLGLRYWVNEQLTVNLEFTKLQADNSEIIFKDDTLVNVGLGVKF